MDPRHSAWTDNSREPTAPGRAGARTRESVFSKSYYQFPRPQTAPTGQARRISKKPPVPKLSDRPKHGSTEAERDDVADDLVASIESSIMSDRGHLAAAASQPRSQSAGPASTRRGKRQKEGRPPPDSSFGRSSVTASLTADVSTATWHRSLRSDRLGPGGRPPPADASPRRAPPAVTAPASHTFYDPRGQSAGKKRVPRKLSNPYASYGRRGTMDEGGGGGGNLALAVALVKDDAEAKDYAALGTTETVDQYKYRRALARRSMEFPYKPTPGFDFVSELHAEKHRVQQEPLVVRSPGGSRASSSPATSALPSPTRGPAAKASAEAQASTSLPADAGSDTWQHPDSAQGSGPRDEVQREIRAALEDSLSSSHIGRRAPPKKPAWYKGTPQVEAATTLTVLEQARRARARVSEAVQYMRQCHLSDTARIHKAIHTLRSLDRQQERHAHRSKMDRLTTQEKKRQQVHKYVHAVGSETAEITAARKEQRLSQYELLSMQWSAKALVAEENHLKLEDERRLLASQLWPESAAPDPPAEASAPPDAAPEATAGDDAATASAAPGEEGATSGPGDAEAGASEPAVSAPASSEGAADGGASSAPDMGAAQPADIDASGTQSFGLRSVLAHGLVLETTAAQ